MRQAIEEGFILDVLQNYMTYSTCFKIAKNTEDNPELPESRAKKDIEERYQELAKMQKEINMYESQKNNENSRYEMMNTIIEENKKLRSNNNYYYT